MILNRLFSNKCYYRFIEFTSKFVGCGMTHEKIKLLCYDQIKAESIEEIEDKEKELLLTHENSPVIFEIYKKEQLANLRNMIQEKVLCALNNGKNPKKKIRAELKIFR